MYALTETHMNMQHSKKGVTHLYLLLQQSCLKYRIMNKCYISQNNHYNSQRNLFIYDFWFQWKKKSGPAICNHYASKLSPCQVTSQIRTLLWFYAKHTPVVCYRCVGTKHWSHFQGSLAAGPCSRTWRRIPCPKLTYNFITDCMECHVVTTQRTPYALWFAFPQTNKGKYYWHEGPTVKTHFFSFRVCKSVHYHTFNWINQQDAATSQVYYLSFK
jgi:hypothetical protein